MFRASFVARGGRFIKVRKLTQSRKSHANLRLNRIKRTQFFLQQYKTYGRKTRRIEAGEAH